MDLIKELIPNIGLRMRFTIKWKETFEVLQNVILLFIIYYANIEHGYINYIFREN